MMGFLAEEGFRFAERAWLLGLWIVPLLVGVLGAGALIRRAGLRRFVESTLLPVMNRRVSTGRRVLKAGLVVAALVGVVMGLARPQWDPQPEEVQSEGRDVCFLVDVSRSMLAQDGPTGGEGGPSRLDRTKLWMQDVVASLGGDRVGLVAFAGTSVVKCPLTYDYGFFDLTVDDLSTESVSRGGTMIGDGVRLAIDEVFGLEGAGDEGLLAGEAPRERDIILITDGEDQGSVPIAAAERAGELGIRIIGIGIGSEEGRRIPYTDDRGRRRFVTDAMGQEVIARLDSETLTRMALATPGGSYLNVADGTIELDEVYRQLVRAADQNEGTISETWRYREAFGYFLAASLLLLVVESLVSERSGRGRR